MELQKIKNITTDDVKGNAFFMISGVLVMYFVAYFLTKGMKNEGLKVLVRIGAVIFGGFYSAYLVEENKEKLALCSMISDSSVNPDGAVNEQEEGEEEITSTVDINTANNVLKLGDKGKIIEDLQSTINLMWGEPIIEDSDFGTLDKKTMMYAKYAFADTSFLVDENTINADRLEDIIIVYENLYEEGGQS